jgi:homoserine dehydrogenase
MSEVNGDFAAPHYVRFIVNDKPGILAEVTAAYARYGINIDGVLQLPRFRKDRLPFVTTLEECPESMLDRALADVSRSDFHVQPPLALPIFA